jgi:hypothetical protein
MEKTGNKTRPKLAHSPGDYVQGLRKITKIK